MFHLATLTGTLIAMASYLPAATLLAILLVNAVRAETDISWGHRSSNCVKENIVSPQTTTTYIAERDSPIVGLFATRFDSKNPIWGTGKLMGTKLAKNECFKSARVYYSVVGGGVKAPTAIDVTFGSKAQEICKWGYVMEVCYDN